MHNSYQIIVSPLITEKTSNLRADSVYVFRVIKDSTKNQIKYAVEKAFGVDVVSINTTKVRGKARKLGKSIGRTSGWKKAYVKIKAGQKIKELEASA